MYKKIIVGVDASENSTRALQVAAEMANEFGAELHVFHAIAHHFQIPTIPFPPFTSINLPSSPSPLDPDVVRQAYEEAGRAIIDHAKNFVESLELGPDFVVDYHLELDVAPEDFAVDFAADSNVDLIVVGCKGHHGAIRRSLMGTVATKIVNEAPCQVLVVR